MYGKIFQSIYDGTLAEDWRALITFQQLIVLCDADGMVDMTPQSIARRTGIPIEHIISGIEVLEKSDKYSRTPDENGKRIELIDSHRPWGWHIINHEKYKNIRDAETIRAQTRERVRKHREKAKCNGGVTQRNASNSKKRHIDTDKETNTNTQDQEKAKTKIPPSLDEVNKYCLERSNKIDPQTFVDHYQANGWMRGKNKIKDWKACVRTWEKQSGQSNNQNESRAKRVNNKLHDIAEKEIADHGFTENLGGSNIREVPS